MGVYGTDGELLSNSSQQLTYDTTEPTEELYHGISIASPGVVRRAIEDGANLNCTTYLYEERPPLIRAIINLHSPWFFDSSRPEQKEIVKILVEEGADLDVRDKEQSTPLHKATSLNNLNLVKLLHENKADIDATNEKGETPLFCAVNAFALEVIPFLIGNGANVNTSNNEDVSLFHLLADYDDESLGKVASLFEKVANVNFVDKEGRTPLDIAVKTKNIAAQNFLLEKGAKRGDVLS